MKQTGSSNRMKQIHNLHPHTGNIQGVDPLYDHSFPQTHNNRN